MKKSLTPNKDMTIEDVIRVLVYRPYGDDLEVMIDSDERIHIKGSSWMVTLDHRTGDFKFKGRMSRYYDVDMIQSIRDAFGQIYSFYNIKYDSIPVDTWIGVDATYPELTRLQMELDTERKERQLQWRRDYYQKNKDVLLARVKEYQDRKRDTSINTEDDTK